MRRLTWWIRAPLILAALAGVIVASVEVAAWLRLRKVHAIGPIPELSLGSDSLTLARGEHLARVVANCTECHADDFGGKVYVDAGILGRVTGPNLTAGRGGVGAQLETEDWVRAIRYGVDPAGRSLIVMPSETFVYLSEEDLAAVIAYLRRVPPVDRDLSPTRLRLLGKALLISGRLPILVAEKTPRVDLETAVTPAKSVAYGRYLADISGCRGCHGLNMSGGAVAGPPGTPPASNLTPAGPIASWTEAEFQTLLREGRRPDGSLLSDFMPWRAFGGMTDEETGAIWMYLHSLPALETGNR